MPRRKKDDTPKQGSIFSYEVEEEDAKGDEVCSHSILIEPAVILELAALIKEGKVETTSRGQLKFSAYTYEADGDANYFESGILWSQDIHRDDWEEVLEDWAEVSEQLGRRGKSKRSSKSGKSDRQRSSKGNSRSRR